MPSNVHSSEPCLAHTRSSIKDDRIIPCHVYSHLVTEQWIDSMPHFVSLTLSSVSDIWRWESCRIHVCFPICYPADFLYLQKQGSLIACHLLGSATDFYVTDDGTGEDIVIGNFMISLTTVLRSLSQLAPWFPSNIVWEFNQGRRTREMSCSQQHRSSFEKDANMMLRQACAGLSLYPQISLSQSVHSYCPKRYRS